jgi:2-methylisocitrate lyase-like PEP mutase family enzyme
MPNPWDRGSAVILQRLGFRALASSSAGFAFTRALPDRPDAISRDQMLEHLRDLIASTDLPINADYQNGYGDDPESLARSIELCVETGVAGLSIEDAGPDPAQPLYDLKTAVERVKIARKTIDATRSGVVLTARAECFLYGHPDAKAESIKRLVAYAEAGADVLYAPGPRDLETIRAIVEAVAPKPVNVLLGFPTALEVEQVAALGVRRISVGSALARVAWSAFIKAAEQIRDHGTFGAFDGLPSTSQIGEWF